MKIRLLAGLADFARGHAVLAHRAGNHRLVRVQVEKEVAFVGLGLLRCLFEGILCPCCRVDGVVADG